MSYKTRATGLPVSSSPTHKPAHRNIWRLIGKISFLVSFYSALLVFLILISLSISETPTFSFSSSLLSFLSHPLVFLALPYFPYFPTLLLFRSSHCNLFLFFMTSLLLLFIICISVYFFLLSSSSFSPASFLFLSFSRSPYFLHI